jgi:uncharacterized RDD family membrane protein YckC
LKAHWRRIGLLRSFGGSTSSEGKPELTLASWEDRIYAWFIDFLILGVICVPVYWYFGVLALFLTFNVLAYFYWMFMEGMYGASFGKRILKLKVKQTDGHPIGLLKAAIKSLGKTSIFLLDFLVGYVFPTEKKQTFFNRLSDTIVVKEKSQP